MSDSIIARSNAFYATTGSQKHEQTNFDPQHTDGHHVRQSNAGSTGHQLNLRDALEWLLGSHAPKDEEGALSHEEKAARRNRRMELLMWLLNLEPRLTPYGDY